MELEYVPLFKTQRELYGIPRGMERFRAYLSTMVDPATGDMSLPLPAMNPMAKDHVPALLDRYLELGADEIAEHAVADAQTELEGLPGQFKVTLVLSDDAMGGWTNRYSSEFTFRFGTRAYLKRGWAIGILWSSETPSTRRAREEALTAVYRAVYILQNGYASTLEEMMKQEGNAMARAGCSSPALPGDEIGYTRDALDQHLKAKDHPTLISCLFGDAAASELGYPPLGLSDRAGLALALHYARCSEP